jgi:hypothetical protein
MTNDTNDAHGAEKAASPKRPRLGLKYGAGPMSGRPLPQTGGRR